MAQKEKAVYTDSTAKRDLDSRLSEEYVPPKFNDAVNPNSEKGHLATEDEDGDGVFVGVSPEYANAAVDTDRPLQAEEGADELAEDAFAESYEKSDGTVSDSLKEAHDKVTRDDVPGVAVTASSETPATTDAGGDNAQEGSDSSENTGSQQSSPSA